MKTKCPHCKSEQDVPDAYVRSEVKCAKCKETFVPSDSIREVQQALKAEPKRPTGFYNYGISLELLGCFLALFGVLAIAAALAYASDAIVPAVLAFIGGLLLWGLGRVCELLGRILEAIKEIRRTLAKNAQ